MATMNDLANLLGVKIGERFDARSTKFENLRYSGLLLTDEGFDDNDSEIRIEQLFNGEFTVIKKQFKPNFGETYYYAVSGSNNINIYGDTFNGSISDFEHFAVGNCFRTKLDAERDKEEVLKKGRTIYEEACLFEDVKKIHESVTT